MIAAVERCSFVDFPGRLAAVAFTQGCNLRCRYCHNPELCRRGIADPEANANFLSFLARRRGLLSGVVLCGGEPTLWPGLEHLLTEVRVMGFAVKLDTNGTQPDETERLLSRGLVDYLAVDIKAAPGEISRWLCGEDQQARLAIKTLRRAIAKHIPCEARTVLVRGVHDEHALSWIAHQLAEAGPVRWRLIDVQAGRLDSSASLHPPDRNLIERTLTLAKSLGLDAWWSTSRAADRSRNDDSGISARR
jgi:pyruvate formate lyase activating enzyme